MINPVPKNRPSASEILQDPFIGEYSKEQLRKELNEEKFKNDKSHSKCNYVTDIAHNSFDIDL